MLDWFSAQVGVDASDLQLNKVYEVSREGVLLYESERWLEVQGSFASSVRVKGGCREGH